MPSRRAVLPAMPHTLMPAARLGWLCGLLCTAPLAAQAQAPAPAVAGPAPVPVAVATFNMAWAGTMEDFQRHLAVCGAPTVNWCDTRARWAPGTQQATPEETARAAACQAATMEAAGGREASMRVAPCGAYRDSSPRTPGAPPPDPAAVRQPQAYAAKLDGLRATVQAMVERDGVRVIAFQEVSSEAAVRAVLGPLAPRFDVCAAPHGGFQTVAFAWDRSLSPTPGRCATHQPLAVLDPPTDPAAFRRVRPGLALELQLGGAPVTFLNVHLKAGCASVNSSNPRFPGRLLTDPAEACDTFNRQIPILEAWIEDVAARSPRFVLLGDLNRRIDDEQAMAVPKDQVRADGADPAGPNRPGADGRVATRYLWPELSDGAPNLFLLPLAGVDAGCRGFIGLDHIVVSAALHATMLRAEPAALAARKVPVVNAPGQLIESSDHCPQVARLLL
jgi:endonuclease/exonuclease/phosphatase family metal-dependent hydrolase